MGKVSNVKVEFFQVFNFCPVKQDSLTLDQKFCANTQIDAHCFGGWSLYVWTDFSNYVISKILDLILGEPRFLCSLAPFMYVACIAGHMSCCCLHATFGIVTPCLDLKNW